jgi:soluble lytic murein transglycosylase-like protein
MIQVASAKWGVSGALIKAIIKKESGFYPNAQNPEGTPADASDDSYGLMQVSLMVAQDYGIVKDWRNAQGVEMALLFDPQINILCGSWQLKRLLLKYPLEVAIQMYNVGERGYNSGYRAAQYLADVMRFYNDYRAL